MKKMNLLRYEKDIKLAGIIYLHRITDNRMGGNFHRNLRMFGELCGDQAVKKVVLVTTMWDEFEGETDPQTHNQRERALFDTYWKKMINYGASTARFLNSPDSAWKIIDPFLKQHETEVLLLQEELVDLKRALNETQVGKTLYSDLQMLLASQRDIVRSIVDGAREESNPQHVHGMEAKLKRIQKDSDKTLNDIKRLEIPLHRRLLLLVGKRSRGVRTIDSSNLILLSTSLFCFNSGPCVYNTWWIGRRSLFASKIFHLAIRAVVDIRNLVLSYGYDHSMHEQHQPSIVWAMSIVNNVVNIILRAGMSMTAFRDPAITENPSFVTVNLKHCPN